MWKRIKDWWLDTQAERALSEQFWSVTGHPAYLPTKEEARAFRLSGMTAHKWILTGANEWRRAAGVD